MNSHSSGGKISLLGTAIAAIIAVSMSERCFS